MGYNFNQLLVMLLIDQDSRWSFVATKLDGRNALNCQQRHMELEKGAWGDKELEILFHAEVGYT